MSGYIGTQPVPQSTQTRDSFTATSGQTSFATGGYQSGYIDLYLNGIKLAAADYTATNNSDVVLAVGAAAGDILEVVAYTAFNTANVTGAVDFTVTNNIVVGGTVDGRDVAADGVTADAALPKAGGTMTGDITRGGTVIQDGTITDTGDFTLDVAGRVILSADDNGEIRLQDGTSIYGQFKDDEDRFKIQSMISNKAMLLVGNDGGAEVTALQLDMENAGAATFNAGATLNGSLNVTGEQSGDYLAKLTSTN